MTLTLSILTGCKNVSEEAIAATPADSEMERRCQAIQCRLWLTFGQEQALTHGSTTSGIQVKNTLTTITSSTHLNENLDRNRSI